MTKYTDYDIVDWLEKEIREERYPHFDLGVDGVTIHLQSGSTDANGHSLRHVINNAIEKQKLNVRLTKIDEEANYEQD